MYSYMWCQYKIFMSEKHDYEVICNEVVPQHPLMPEVLFIWRFT